MTKLFDDVLRQPGELSKSLEYTLGEGRARLKEAAELIRKTATVYIVGMGSSWNAGWAVLNFFNAKGRSAILADASELLHFGDVAKDSAVILLSRSGKSTEIVNLMDRLRLRNAKTIAVTNTPDSPLAMKADVVLQMHVAFDNAVSITMYSALGMIGGVLAATSLGDFDEADAGRMQTGFAEASKRIGGWQESIEESKWMSPGSPTYFLGRGAGLASCHEARLLWEEAAKVAASAMPTGGFRHGPQEMLREGVRIGMWIDGAKMREEDLALAKDLRYYGAQVLLIGQGLPEDAGELVLNLPGLPAQWQFVLDIVPIQIAAERLAQVGAQNCDAFRICSYIVEEEGGLIRKVNKQSESRSESVER